MAYEGTTAEIPVGRGIALVRRANRLQHTPGELVRAEGVTLEDGSYRKEMGAVLFDSAGIAGSPSEAVTLGASSIWAGDMSVFLGSAIATGGTAVTVAKAVSSGSSFITATVPASGYASGTLVILVVLVNSSTHAVLNFGVSDSKSNVWTLNTNVNLTVANMRVAYSLLTTALVSGDTISAAMGGDVAAIAAVANFTGLTGVKAGGATRVSVGTGATVGPTGSISSAPYLVVTGLTSTNASAAFAPGSLFTELIEGSGAGSGDVAVHYRIDATSPTIIAMQDWASDVQTTPAGTVTTTSGSAAVVGVGTTFTNHAPGDKLIINAETRIILSVTDNTNLTTTEPWASSNAGVAYDRRVGTRLITATLDGKLYKDKPDSLTTTNLDATTLKSGLSLLARPGRFVIGGKEAAANNRKLFYFNGVDPIQVLSGDGTSTTAISTPPSDWSATANPQKEPINGTVHNNRLVAWGNLNDPHRLYFSDPDNHENFTSASAFNMRVVSNVGDRLICGVDYQGVLILWKYPRGIFYLDDTDLTASNWLIRTKSEALGCAPSPYAVLPLDDDVMFLASDGNFHMLSAVDTFGGVQASSLSYGLAFANWTREQMNLERLDQVTSVWFPQKKVALFGVPAAGDSTNTLTLRFDFSAVSNGEPVKFTVSYRDNPDALALKRFSDNVYRPILGEAGFVWLTEQDARTKDGAYAITIQTADDDFSRLNPILRYKRKVWEHLELVMEPVAAGTITAVVSIDGVARQTLTFDATQARQRRKLNVGDGYAISVTLSNNADNEDMNVIGIGVMFTAGNEDQNR